MNCVRDQKEPKTNNIWLNIVTDIIVVVVVVFVVVVDRHTAGSAVRLFHPLARRGDRA